MTDTKQPDNERSERSERRRVIQWEDPLPGLIAGQKMTGLEFLQAITRGELPAPPIAELMGFSFSEIEPGRVVCVCEPAEVHYNPMGVAHGGLAATLCDTALACAILTMLPIGVRHTTLELKVNYIRPLTQQTGLVRCIGQVVHVGRQMGTAEAKLVDVNDKLYAHASTTCMIFQPAEIAREVIFG